MRFLFALGCFSSARRNCATLGHHDSLASSRILFEPECPKPPREDSVRIPNLVFTFFAILAVAPGCNPNSSSPRAAADIPPPRKVSSQLEGSWISRATDNSRNTKPDPAFFPSLDFMYLSFTFDNQDQVQLQALLPGSFGFLQQGARIPSLEPTRIDVRFGTLFLNERKQSQLRFSEEFFDFARRHGATEDQIGKIAQSIMIFTINAQGKLLISTGSPDHPPTGSPSEGWSLERVTSSELNELRGRADSIASIRRAKILSLAPLVSGRTFDLVEARSSLYNKNNELIGSRTTPADQIPDEEKSQDGQIKVNAKTLQFVSDFGIRINSKYDLYMEYYTTMDLQGLWLQPQTPSETKLDFSGTARGTIRWLPNGNFVLELGLWIGTDGDQPSRVYLATEFRPR